MRVSVLCTALFLFGADLVYGQQLVGTIRDQAGRPLSQSTVTLFLQGGDTLHASSGSNGGFIFQLDRAGAHVLRVERTGYVTVEVDVVVASGANVRRDIRLEPSISIQAMSVTVTRPCGAPLSRTSAQVWHQIASGAGPAVGTRRYDTVLYLRRLDHRMNVVSTDSIPQSVSAPGPYRSQHPDTLITRGFVSWDTTAAEWLFEGPDADVLFSPAFQQYYCMSDAPVQSYPGGRLVGIRYRPIDEDRPGAIIGTIWADSASLSLKYAEFKFVNAPYDRPDLIADGRTDFCQLSDGAWIVVRWMMRVPTFIESATGRHLNHGGYREYENKVIGATGLQDCRIGPIQ